MKFDEMQVVMLEIVKSAKMEHDENCHNLAIGHTRRTPSADLALGTQKRHISSLSGTQAENIQKYYYNGYNKLNVERLKEIFDGQI